jgi:predicted MFS family arabinose efflux permease
MALAVVMSGGAIGAMVLPPVAEALIERVGWRAACVVLGGMVLAIGCLRLPALSANGRPICPGSRRASRWPMGPRSARR